MRPTNTTPFARRVRVYAHALASDQRPNAYGVTPAETADHLADHLPTVDRYRAEQVLRAVGVSL